MVIVYDSDLDALIAFEFIFYYYWMKYFMWMEIPRSFFVGGVNSSGTIMI